LHKFAPHPKLAVAWEKNFHMDSAAILMVLFGSVISVTTALTFMEVRRMRKSGMK
jgi:hypothetical protein